MKYVYIFSISLLLILGSCNITNNDCGDFKGSYIIKNFDSSIKSITYNTDNRLTFELAEINDDKINSNKYAIHIDPIEEYYKSISSNSFAFGFTSVAYACTPPIPTTNALIENIKITSDEDFNQQFLANSDLRELFDIIIVQEGMSNKIQSLPKFLESPSMVPNNMVLVLNQAPEEAKNLSFYVTLELQNTRYQYLSFKTKHIKVINSK